MNETTLSIAPIVLIVNGFTLALSLSFLLIILWYDIRRTIYQFFAIFLVLVAVWNIGFLLSQANYLTITDTRIANLAVGIANIGFTGSSAGIYALATVFIGIQTRYFRVIAIVGIGVIVAFNVIILTNNLTSTSSNSFSLRSLSGFFYLLFDTVSLYLISRYRRKIQNNGLVLGIVIFVLGQGIGFFNAELGIASGSLFISSLGTLIISFSLIRQELITPLINRNQQLETMHEVSLAITSRITTNTLLTEIAQRAVTWLIADAACIYLLRDDILEMVALHNLPLVLLHTKNHIGESLAGNVAQVKKSILLENYSRDWRMDAEFVSVSDTFGSVIGTPLIYDEQVIGVLVVIASKQNKLLNTEDVHLLELLSSQAAVAIAHDRLFNNRMLLTEQLQLAHDQLRTVLTSTESPVIALDRSFQLIFSNRAATQILEEVADFQRKPFTQALPTSVLPLNYRKVLQDVQKTGVHIYEILIHDKTYLCHLASWGVRKVEGWVVVLHDVTELKELDRIKSEMVRMTSHDLKNPLQAAMANLDLLRDDIEEAFEDNPEIELSLMNVEKQLNKMQRIIGSILDLERVRLGVHLNEICQPSEIVANAIEEMGDIAQDKRIELTVTVEQGLIEFLGDRAQFERALINLIDNAIKFTPKHGQVDLTVSQKDHEIIFCVKDNGVGIPKELHSLIFERFYRGRQTGIEHVSGTGLGLSLVKAVVESHHGRIWVESQLGSGASFFVAVPAYRENVPHITHNSLSK